MIDTADLETGIQRAETLQAMATRLGVSRERVRQVLKERWLHEAWDLARAAATPDPLPLPPTPICHWCGREVEQRPEWYRPHVVHNECRIAYGVYCARISHRERYRTDPALRQRYADWRRNNPERSAEIHRRWRENKRLQEAS